MQVEVDDMGLKVDGEVLVNRDRLLTMTIEPGMAKVVVLGQLPLEQHVRLRGKLRRIFGRVTIEEVTPATHDPAVAGKATRYCRADNTHDGVCPFPECATTKRCLS